MTMKHVLSFLLGSLAKWTHKNQDKIDLKPSRCDVSSSTHVIQRICVQSRVRARAAESARSEAISQCRIGQVCADSLIVG
ncbi:hypothetical protein J3E69DRAFT_319532 [Trichoderma sp. SZMC 28015]